MIRSIELKNWKTHKNTKLDFSKGTNILIGQMGSGKSSIMDAISYALFGTFPSIQHRRVNVSKIIRNKPRQERNAHVKLEFSLDGSEYAIKREITFDAKAATATIEKNGAYLQSQPQRVTEEIERILKIDYDLFSKVVYSEQNGLDYFINLSPTDRKRQIDGLLGLDKFALAQENTTNLINRVRDMVADTERIAREFDIEKAREDLEALNKENDKLSKEKKDAEKKLDELATARSKSEKELGSLKEQYSKKLTLAKELEGLRSRSALLENEIKKIESQVMAERGSVAKELEKLKEDSESIRKEDSKLSESERKLNSIIAKLEADIANANRDAAEREKLSKKISAVRKDAVEKGIEECNSLIEQLSSGAAQSSAAVLDTENQIKELEKHISRCPVCERELDEGMKKKLLDEKRKAISESKKKAAEYSSRLEKKKAEAKELTAQLNDLTVVEERLKGYSGIDGKLDSYKKSITEAKKEYEKIKSAKEKSESSMVGNLESIHKLKSTIESLDRRERHIAERNATEDGISRKTKELGSIKADQKELDGLQEELVKVNSEMGRHAANIDSAAKYIKDKENQITEKKREIEKIDKIKEDVVRKRALIDNLSKFKTSLFETQSLLRTQLINSINGIMHEVWRNLYPYGDYQSLTMDASDDDYRLRVKTLVNGEYVWEDVEAIASGGERSTASLAMRIAFSLVLVPNLKWLILDEPTHNIDREGLSKFVRVFGDTLPNIIDQVFIITHDEVLKEVNSAKIYSFSRNKDENKETEVSRIS